MAPHHVCQTVCAVSGRLPSLLSLLLQHAATLEVSVQQGDGKTVVVKRVTLAPQTWSFVDTADVPQLQQAARIVFSATAGAPFCGAEEAPVFLLSAVDAGAQAPLR